MPVMTIPQGECVQARLSRVLPNICIVHAKLTYLNAPAAQQPTANMRRLLWQDYPQFLTCNHKIQIQLIKNLMT